MNGFSNRVPVHREPSVGVRRRQTAVKLLRELPAERAKRAAKLGRNRPPLYFGSVLLDTQRVVVLCGNKSGTAELYASSLKFPFKGRSFFVPCIKTCQLPLPKREGA